MVAIRSLGVMGVVRGTSARAEESPTAWPMRRPPPARARVHKGPQWSRPAEQQIYGLPVEGIQAGHDAAAVDVAVDVVELPEQAAAVVDALERLIKVDIFG